ncbi:MAG: hypothetical protein DMF74_05025, partial [Acidobacteria bacterium]
MKSQPPKPKPISKLASIPPSVARILTAVVLLPILIASILVEKLAYLFVALAGIAMGAALVEFWKLARKQQTRADFAAGFLGGLALFIVFLFSEPGKLDLLMIQFILILLTIGTLTAAMLRGAPFDRMITSAGITVLGVLYIVLLGGHLVALRVGFAPQLSKHLLSFFFLVI